MHSPITNKNYCETVIPNTDNWRLRWKKGVRFFTQKWTLSKTLQILHAVLFTCVKQCSTCFFPEVCIVFEILRMQKTLYLLWRQHMTAKTVISLQIQQIIDLSQRVTLKIVDFRLQPLKFWLHIITPPQGLKPLGLKVPSFIRVRVRDYRPKLGLALKVRVRKQG